jgi:multimeric flavodoxin WrbA
LTDLVEVIDLGTVDIRGGCMGCIHCGYDNTCAYKDGLKQFIQQKLIPAEAIIFAGAIKDRYLSSRWKQYFDRSFVFGHTPYLNGKQVGFIISGPLRQLPNLRQVFEAYAEAQQCTLAGFATDEDGAPEAVTEGLQALAAKLSWALEHDLKAPPSYLSFGVQLVFRDFVPQSSGVFRADHIYYKKHGMYRDHHNNLRRRMTNLLFTAICCVPSLRREFQKKMKPGMIAGLKKIVDAPELLHVGGR